MLARFLTLGCGLFLALSAGLARADGACGANVPERPRCSLPSLPSDRMPIMTCHTLPVTDAGRMVRLSRGFALLDIKAELFTVNADLTSITLNQEWGVREDDHSTANVIDKEYVADGFYFHTVLRLDNGNTPGTEYDHVTVADLDADIDCGGDAG